MRAALGIKRSQLSLCVGAIFFQLCQNLADQACKPCLPQLIESVSISKTKAHLLHTKSICAVEGGTPDLNIRVRKTPNINAQSHR